MFAAEGQEYLLFAALLRHLAAGRGGMAGQQVALLRELNRQAARMPAPLAIPALILSLQVPSPSPPSSSPCRRGRLPLLL